MFAAFMKFFVFKLLLILLAPVMVLLGTVLAIKMAIWGIKTKAAQFDQFLEDADKHASTNPKGK